MRNLCRLKEEQNYIEIKDLKNLFKLEKEVKAIKGKIRREILKIFLSMKRKLL